MAAAVAAVQPVPRDDIAVKEMLLEHIRQDAIWKAKVEATLRTYGIFLSPESYVGEEDTTAAMTTDSSLGPSENLMRNSSVQPNHQDQQVERSKSCERSDGNGSCRAPPHPGVPSNLVRPILADGTTYAGGSNGQLEVNQDVSNSTVKLPGRSTSVTSEAGSRVVENPRPHRQVAMKRTSQMPMQNIKSSKPASASKRVATKTDMKRYNYYKDCEEARNHIEEMEDSRGRIFKCKLCGHSGNQEAAVIMHIRMSHIGNDRKFACHLCSYRFKQKTHLNYHLTHTHGEETPATATSSNDSNFGEMETDTSNDAGTSATSDGALLQDSNSEMDVEFDLSYAYETFTADDASISYICLTCAEVSKEKAGMVAHILKNHIPGRSQNGNKRETGIPNPTPAQQPSPPEKNDSLPRVAVKRTMPPTHAFTEAEKTAVDQLILNILNPAPPYTCKVCHTILQSKQRARLHVLYKHSEDLDLADS